MDGSRWRRIATVVGYGASALLIAWGAATGEAALVLVGLVALAILLLAGNG